MKTDVVSIKLKVQEREIELTEEEARSIYAKLGEIFDKGQPVIIPFMQVIEREPYPVPHVTYTNPWMGIEWTGIDPNYHRTTCGMS